MTESFGDFYVQRPERESFMVEPLRLHKRNPNADFFQFLLTSAGRDFLDLLADEDEDGIGCYRLRGGDRRTSMGVKWQTPASRKRDPNLKAAHTRYYRWQDLHDRFKIFRAQDFPGGISIPRNNEAPSLEAFHRQMQTWHLKQDPDDISVEAVTSFRQEVDLDVLFYEQQWVRAGVAVITHPKIWHRKRALDPLSEGFERESSWHADRLDAFQMLVQEDGLIHRAFLPFEER